MGPDKCVLGNDRKIKYKNYRYLYFVQNMTSLCLAVLCAKQWFSSPVLLGLLAVRAMLYFCESWTSSVQEPAERPRCPENVPVIEQHIYRRLVR